MTEDEKYLRNEFLKSIKSGLQSQEGIIEEALEIIESEALESVISEDWLREAVKEEYEKHVADSKTWAIPTDPERLQKVFDELSRKKIIALHNAGYNVSDAIYDIETVWKELEDEGVIPIGYCYYHGQDLERAIASDRLPIGFYGKTANNEKEAIVIGKLVASSLKDAGFELEWDGSANKRITIINFKWDNIFTSEEDTEEKWGYDRTVELMKK